MRKAWICCDGGIHANNAACTMENVTFIVLSRFVYVGPWLTLWLVVTALCGSKAAITVLLIFVALSFVPPGDVSPPCLTLHIP